MPLKKKGCMQTNKGEEVARLGSSMKGFGELKGKENGSWKKSTADSAEEKCAKENNSK